MEKKEKVEHAGLVALIWLVNIVVSFALLFIGAFTLQYGFNIVLAGYLGLSLMTYPIALGVKFLWSFMNMGQNRNIFRFVKLLDEEETQGMNHLEKAIYSLKFVSQKTLTYGVFLVIFLVLGNFIK